MSGLIAQSIRTPCTKSHSATAARGRAIALSRDVTIEGAKDHHYHFRPADTDDALRDGQPDRRGNDVSLVAQATP